MLDKKRCDTSRQLKNEDKIGQKTPKLQQKSPKVRTLRIGPVSLA